MASTYRAVRPSETRRGQAWLTNFSPEDEGAARQLLDSLRFVSLSDVRAGLQVRLRSLIAQGKIQVPALLVSALSIEDLRLDEGQTAPSVAFESFQLDDPINVVPGSEGFVGNLIRDLVSPAPVGTDALLAPSTKLNELRDKRCRSIVVITDYAGSGTQLRNYAMTLVRHPTLRSWRSYGLLRIHALSYAGSSQARATLQREDGPFDGVWTVETAPSFQDAPWTAKQRDAIEEICVRYVRKKDRKRALGFKESAGLFATDASVPNNLPLILRQAHSGWHPFFERRTVPPDLFTELGSYAPDVVFKDVATRIGQPRLSSNLGVKYMRSATDEMFLVLALLLDRSRSGSDLARELGKPVATVDVLLRALRTLGLIDDQRNVTSAGKKELTTGKRAPRHVSTGIEGSDAPYYPGSMR